MNDTDSMLHITLVCHVYPPEHAPAGLMTEQLAEDLVAKGFAVTVVTGWPSHPGGELFPGWRSRLRLVEHDSRGFRVVRCWHSLHRRTNISWRMWYYVTFAISSLINGWWVGRTDAVLCLSTPVFGSWTAWLLARGRGARFVYAIFDLHPEAAANAGLLRRGRAYTLMRKADSLLCRWSDSILTLSGGLRDEILARGTNGSKVDVVPLWLDGTKIFPSPRDNAWRRQQGIAPDVFVALYAGTIGYSSGAEVLLETAGHLASRQDILILCVGDGPVKHSLAEAAAAARVTNLRFLDFQPADVLNQVQATADVGLVTLRPGAGSSSFPSKVLGYLAAGRPVIASVAADSDTARVLVRGGCGLVTACSDPKALAEAIQELADNSDVRKNLARNARKYFEEFFDRRRCVEAFEHALLFGIRKDAIDSSRRAGDF